MCLRKYVAKEDCGFAFWRRGTLYLKGCCIAIVGTVLPLKQPFPKDEIVGALTSQYEDSLVLL